MGKYITNIENYINSWEVKELLFSLQNACRKEGIIFNHVLNTDSTNNDIELRFLCGNRYYSTTFNAELFCK